MKKPKILMVCGAGLGSSFACQMTVDLFDFKDENFIEGISRGGAATFLEFAGDADVTLYI